jgi:hypothetical protein
MENDSKITPPTAEEELELIEMRRLMTPWERAAHLRLGIRLVNNDEKARRLLEMFERGQISRYQLFRMM